MRRQSQIGPTHIGSLKACSATWPAESSARASAVCLLVVNSKTRPEILFLRRSTRVSSHKGQIGFPGGRRDPSDINPCATAVRELEEECGVASKHVDVLGELEAHVGLDGMPIYPIVATTTVPFAGMRFAKDEVESAFCAPWELFSRAHAQHFRFNIFGRWRESYLYETEQKQRIWGITARIIYGADLI